MIKTYQFDSTIREDGVIVLPKSMFPLQHHRVKVIVIDWQPSQDDPVAWLNEITQKYTAIMDEADLLLDEIYTQRERNHERSFVFD
ncbi:hypothetical protein U27_06198 [Candidatus Vecturithrix granuli]|uniref:Uncharacterized protein n=1 Tax=Vecturithrix granuli TaxID=1499967 RepID=A0A081C3R6_VECG1|nr:hypothetical protein U27_06198 [Candidatus Vecturithrix granuli]